MDPILETLLAMTSHTTVGSLPKLPPLPEGLFSLIDLQDHPGLASFVYTKDFFIDASMQNRNTPFVIPG